MIRNTSPDQSTSQSNTSIHMTLSPPLLPLLFSFSLFSFFTHSFFLIFFHLSLSLPQFVSFIHPRWLYLSLIFFSHLSFLSSCYREGTAVREVFPTSSSSHFSSAHLTPCPYTHTHTHMHTQAPISSFIASLSSLSVRLQHKCICSIPPANRLAGCYQRQRDGDNGFHYIFSLPQIKMGQVTHSTHHSNTQTHTLWQSLTNTYTHLKDYMSTHMHGWNI